MSYPCYEVYTDEAGEYRFRLLDKYKDNILKASEGYTTKAGCKNAVAVCQKNSPFEKYYDRRTSKNGNYYFTLRSENGRDIGMSKQYDTAMGRDAAIEIVKREGPTAAIS